MFTYVPIFMIYACIHNQMIPIARDEARKMLKNEGDKEKINVLLSIFENNDAIQLLKGG